MQCENSSEKCIRSYSDKFFDHPEHEDTSNPQFMISFRLLKISIVALNRT